MKEEYKSIKNFEGLYEISNLGRVRSLDKLVTRKDGRTMFIKGRLLSIQEHPNGYLNVVLKVDQKPTMRYIHRLVAQAFVPGERDGLIVCHNDGNKHNNCYKNLRWGTPKENSLDTIIHGQNHQLNQTHCRRGHVYGGLNEAPHRGVRDCLACNKASSRAAHNTELKPYIDIVADMYYEQIMLGGKTWLRYKDIVERIGITENDKIQ